jgi:hypothetical protein
MIQCEVVDAELDASSLCMHDIMQPRHKVPAAPLPFRTCPETRRLICIDEALQLAEHQLGRSLMRADKIRKPPPRNDCRVTGDCGCTLLYSNG